MAKMDLLADKRVLIVDDEPDVLETLEDLLSMCEVVKAESFEAAKAHFETAYFDFTILDIMGVDGYKLLEIATKHKVTAVMLTAHALSPENVAKSYKEGAAYYLPKEEMINIVETLEEVLEAREKGKSTWLRWYDRLGSFFEDRFGKDWQKEQAELYKNKYFY